jgi:hypothetical protein
MDLNETYFCAFNSTKNNKQTSYLERDLIFYN